MSSGANDQAKVLQFAAFRDHGWGHAALYQRWPQVFISKLFQPPHSDVFPTIMELSEMQNKDMNLQFPIIHPQLQVSCTFAKKLFGASLPVSSNFLNHR